MFSLITLLIVATATFIAGCLVSFLLTRTFSSNKQKTRSLEANLENAEKDLASYQQEVTEHFSETAKLINNLTENYRDVHEHLAGNALKLANVDISRQLLSTSIDNENKELSINDDKCEPPKDWAPSEGTLSESYGLTDNTTQTIVPPKTNDK